jgi:hypothetical protein
MPILGVIDGGHSSDLGYSLGYLRHGPLQSGFTRMARQIAARGPYVRWPGLPGALSLAARCGAALRPALRLPALPGLPALGCPVFLCSRIRP